MRRNRLHHRFHCLHLAVAQRQDEVPGCAGNFLYDGIKHAGDHSRLPTAHIIRLLGCFGQDGRQFRRLPVQHGVPAVLYRRATAVGQRAAVFLLCSIPLAEQPQRLQGGGEHRQAVLRAGAQPFGAQCRREERGGIHHTGKAVPQSAAGALGIAQHQSGGQHRPWQGSASHCHAVHIEGRFSVILHRNSQIHPSVEDKLDRGGQLPACQEKGQRLPFIAQRQSHEARCLPHSGREEKLPFSPLLPAEITFCQECKAAAHRRNPRNGQGAAHPSGMQRPHQVYRVAFSQRPHSAGLCPRSSGQIAVEIYVQRNIRQRREGRAAHLRLGEPPVIEADPL